MKHTLKSGRLIEFNNNVPRTPIRGKMALVEELNRSTQIVGVLCRVDKDNNIVGECCLGVACRIENLPYRVNANKNRYYIGKFTSYLDYVGDSGLTSTGSLPALVISNANNHGTLVSLNDNGFDFGEIAEIIDIMFVEREEYISLPSLILL